MPRGTIKSLPYDRAFGFITPDDGSPDLFFHMTAVVGTKPSHMMLDTYVSLPWQKNQAYSTAAAPTFRPPTDTFSLEAWAVVGQAKYKYVSSIMWLGLVGTTFAQLRWGQRVADDLDTDPRHPERTRAVNVRPIED